MDDDVLQALRDASDEPPAGYLEIDHFSNAVDFLRKADMFLGTGSDPFRWKWCCLSLFSGLYGLMTSVLGHSNPDRVLLYSHNKAEKKKLKALTGDNSADAATEKRSIRLECRRRGDVKLISFGEALKRIQIAGWMEIYVHVKAVSVSPAEKNDIDQLREVFRNSFEHFIPMHWSIEEAIFPPILISVCSVLRKLIESGHIGVLCCFHSDAGESVQSIESLVGSIEGKLKALAEGEGGLPD